jgi:hypothetical protein
LAGIILEFATLPEVYFPDLSPGASVRVVATASTYPQAHDILWREVMSQHFKAKFPLGGKMSVQGSWELSDRRSVIIANPESPLGLHGRHAAAVLVVVDEGEHLTVEKLRALESLMTGEHARMVIAYNPVLTSGPCYDLSLRPDLANLVHLSVLEHPNLVSGEEVIPGAATKTWVDEVRAKEGEGSPTWISRVLGEHPAEGTNQLVAPSALREHVSLAVPQAPRVGMDVARFGGDRNVIVLLDEHRNVVEVESWVGQDLMTSTGRLIAALDRWRLPGHAARVDVCGLGAGVVDRAREQGYHVGAVDFGAGPEGDWTEVVAWETKFANRRAELWWVMRRLVLDQAIGVPEHYREMRADLTAPTYSYDSQGRVVVEKKEDIRKRLGRSPDHGDAVVIALANTGGLPSAGWL